MASPKDNYSKANARSALLRIRKTASGKRLAYAVGRYAPQAQVVVVVPGSPAKAKATLNKAEYAKGSEPKGVKLDPKVQPVSWGLIRFDPNHPRGKVLIVESTRKPPPQLPGYFRNFFAKQFQVGMCWSKVILRRLNGDDNTADHDEAADIDNEPDADLNAGEAAMEAGADQEPEIIDEWEDEPAPAHTEGVPPPADTTADAKAEPPPYPQADPALHAQAEKLTQYVVSRAQNLFPGAVVDPDQLQGVFEKLLQNVPYERVLLELARAANVDALVRGTGSASEDAPAPLQHDANGIAEVTDALVGMGTKHARQRGMLDPGETPNGNKIQSMVKQQWTDHVETEALITKLIGVLGPTFEKAPEPQVRGLLGLSAHRVAADNGAAGATPAEAGQNGIDTIIPALVARCQEVRANISRQIDDLKQKVAEALVQSYGPDASVEGFGGSWDRVNELSSDVDPDKLAAALNAVAGTAGDVRQQRLEALRTEVSAAFSALQGNPLIEQLDGAPFDIEMSLQENISGLLTEISAQLEDVGR